MSTTVSASEPARERRDMSMQIPESTRPLLEVLVPVRWADMDCLGHVNNAAYFTYMEIARVAWLESLGSAAPAGQGLVIVNAFCQFHTELAYPGELRVRMAAGQPGRSSFDTYYTLHDAADDTVVYASGGAKAVWFDQTLRRSSPLPPELRALLEG
jgi:acyl-CoA thioester hydrolase